LLCTQSTWFALCDLLTRSLAHTQIKRTLLGTLSDAAYNSIQSFHSDSAVSFAVFLNHLPDMTRPQPPEVLLQAMEVRDNTRQHSM
jgi:hypothetical protein